MAPGAPPGRRALSSGRAQQRVAGRLRGQQRVHGLGRRHLELAGRHQGSPSARRARRWCRPRPRSPCGRNRWPGISRGSGCRRCRSLPSGTAGRSASACGPRSGRPATPTRGLSGAWQQLTPRPPRQHAQSGPRGNQEVAADVDPQVVDAVQELRQVGVATRVPGCRRCGRTSGRHAACRHGAASRCSVAGHQRQVGHHLVQAGVQRARHVGAAVSATRPRARA